MTTSKMASDSLHAPLAAELNILRIYKLHLDNQPHNDIKRAIWKFWRLQKVYRIKGPLMCWERIINISCLNWYMPSRFQQFHFNNKTHVIFKCRKNTSFLSSNLIPILETRAENQPYSLNT